MRKAKILFFVNGPAVDDEVRAAAHELNATVCFRNTREVRGPLEQCDGVAGEVPEDYAEAFPDAETAIELIESLSDKDASIVGGAPKKRRKKKKADENEDENDGDPASGSDGEG